ncbi:aminodeoxychorismate/anthranilate synthase component II [uncultured Planktosalinus sp.]|uniref:anthranilate synthase component II n=1 Tax=uncultured Planktosalinus sp. TaxID=1810935 RepID=UPI0030D7BA33
MKILVIDNYDSFVYNIVHYLENLDVDQVHVVKNDKFELDLINIYDKIVLSPGPGIPKDAGLMPQVILEFGAVKPILGVCLGHQAIAESFGGALHNLESPLHGIASRVEVTQEDYLFKNIPKQFNIGHYHSWVVKPELPATLEVLAKDAFGNIMALKHSSYDLRGVQFHPESVLTEYGHQLLENWIKQ